MNWLFGLLEERLQWVALRTDAVCCCVSLGFYDSSSLFFNLLPAFPNSEISHKNQGFWLLLKKKKKKKPTEDLAIVALYSLVATSQPNSNCPRHGALTSLLPLFLGIWVCGHSCNGFRKLFSKSLIIIFFLKIYCACVHMHV